MAGTASALLQTGGSPGSRRGSPTIPWGFAALTWLSEPSCLSPKGPLLPLCLLLPAGSALGLQAALRSPRLVCGLRGLRALRLRLCSELLLLSSKTSLPSPLCSGEAGSGGWSSAESLRDSVLGLFWKAKSCGPGSGRGSIGHPSYYWEAKALAKGTRSCCFLKSLMVCLKPISSRMSPNMGCEESFFRVL